MVCRLLLLRTEWIHIYILNSKNEIIDPKDIFLYVINQDYVSDTIFAGSYQAISKLVSFYDVSDDFYINKNQGWTCEFNERHMKNYINESGLNIRNYN